MNAREEILENIRTALGRADVQTSPSPPEALIRVPEAEMDQRIERFRRALEALNGKTYLAASAQEARQHAEQIIGGRTAVSSNGPLLAELGITGLPGVTAGGTDRARLRQLCVESGVGVTSAEYALADTGTLVMISSEQEARMVSLLPPCHLAVVPRQRLLTGLDELLTILPHPAERSSSMVLITGPSRTADIEQILVRGVHGPAEIHVVLV